MMSAVSSWGRYIVLAVGLMLTAVMTVAAQSNPQQYRARTTLLYGPAEAQETVDTTDGSGRRLQAALHAGGGFLAAGGAVAGGIQAATLLQEGANRSIGAVLAIGALGLGIAGVLLIRRGILLLRTNSAAASRSDWIHRGELTPSRTFGSTIPLSPRR